MKAEACTQGALLYVLLSFAEGGVGGIFFSIFLGSQCVLTMFFLSSQWGSHQLPNMFLKFSMHSPNMFSIASHFYPICFGKRCPPFTILPFPSISVGRKWWKTYVQIKIVTSQWGRETWTQEAQGSFFGGMWRAFGLVDFLLSETASPRWFE